MLHSLYFNNLLTTGCYFLSVKILRKYTKKDLKVLIIIVHFARYICYTKVSSYSNASSWLNTINPNDSSLYVPINQCHRQPYAKYLSPVGESTATLDYFWNCNSFWRTWGSFFSTNHLQKSVHGLFVEILETFIYYDFVLNNFESLRAWSHLSACV